MIFKIIFTALSWAAPLIIISDNAPYWMVVLAWVYMFIILLLGVMLLNADKISAWSDKVTGKKDDGNDP